MEKALTEHDGEPGRGDEVEPAEDRRARQRPSRIRRDALGPGTENKKLSPIWILVVLLLLWALIALAGYGLSRFLVSL
jgi:hypothetical protein